MKILFLTSSFNSLTQRFWIELDRLNHQVKLHIVQEDELMEAVAKEFEPDLIIAPYLKKKIPHSIWSQFLTWIVHPGIPGDRGSSSLDWAILESQELWGCCILEAAEKMDTGPIWGYAEFGMRSGSKASIYRLENTEAAVKALKQALSNLAEEDFIPLDPVKAIFKLKGSWKASCKQKDYAFQWEEDAEAIIRKIQAADSAPGVLIELFGENFFAFGAHPEEELKGKPGQILARRDQAICLACGDKAIWISHLKQDRSGAIKLPACLALGEKANSIPLSELDPFAELNHESYQEIRFEQIGEAGFISFDFYNGAMSTAQCKRLGSTIQKAKSLDLKILVLMGGADLWSNGIHLNEIEASDKPEETSWENILAINDLIKEILLSQDHYVISALRGNAGAGGVPMALAADKVFARDGIVLNPHTRQMGLYGSEYWTYLLPRRIGTKKAQKFTEECLPWGTALAKEIGLVDDVFGHDFGSFEKELKARVQELSELSYFDKLLLAKKLQRRKDERIKPLEEYRKTELEHMWKNFFENDRGYSEKRRAFVHKLPSQDSISQEKDLYSSRRKIYRRRKWESISYKE